MSGLAGPQEVSLAVHTRCGEGWLVDFHLPWFGDFGMYHREDYSQ
jgi:hypothetical protein